MAEHTVGEVFHDLVRLETLLWNRIDARVRTECRVGLGSIDVLRVVSATPDCRVNDIARALAITVGGASQAVDRLVAAGSCVRRPHASDRRSSLVETTLSGRERLAAAQLVIDLELEATLRRPLSDRAFQQLGTVLAALRAIATTSPPSTTSAVRPQENP